MEFTGIEQVVVDLNIKDSEINVYLDKNQKKVFAEIYDTHKDFVDAFNKKSDGNIVRVFTKCKEDNYHFSNKMVQSLKSVCELFSGVYD